MSVCVLIIERLFKWASNDVYVWVSESLLLQACTAHGSNDAWISVSVGLS